MVLALVFLVALGGASPGEEQDGTSPKAGEEVVRWYWIPRWHWMPQLYDQGFSFGLTFETSQYGWDLRLARAVVGTPVGLSLVDVEVPARTSPLPGRGQVYLRTTHQAGRHRLSQRAQRAVESRALLGQAVHTVETSDACRLTNLSLYVDDVLCTEFRFAYDTSGRPVRRLHVDYGGPGSQQPDQPVSRNEVSYHYSSDGQRVSVILEETWQGSRGGVFRPAFPLVSYVEAVGGTLGTWQLDGSGHIVHAIDETASEPAWTGKYDEDGHLVSVVQGYGESAEYRYDSKGRVVEAQVWEVTDIGYLHLYEYPDGERPRLPEKAWEMVTVVVRDDEGRARSAYFHFPQESDRDHSVAFERDRQGLLTGLELKQETALAKLEELGLRQPPQEAPEMAGVPAALLAQLQIPDTGTRTRALGQLSQYGGAALPYARKALTDQDPFVRMAAAAAVHGISRETGEVLAVFYDCLEEGAAVRCRAVLGLAALAGEREDVLRKVCEVALTDEDWTVRKYAIDGMARMGRERRLALNILHDQLSSADGRVRVRSAEALCKLVHSLALESLTEELTGGDEMTRQLAAQAMGELGPIYGRGVNELVEALGDSRASIEFRRLAAESLARVVERDDDWAVPYLIRYLQRTRDNELRASLAKVLARYGPLAEPAVPALLKLLQDPEADYWCKMAVLEAFGEMGTAAEEAAPALLELKDTRPVNVREAVHQALTRMGFKDQLGIDKRVEELLEAADDGKRDAVARLLEEGVDVNATDVRGRTALYFAANRLTVAQLLLEKGADPNVQTATGETALMEAARLADGTPVLELLLEAGADPDLRFADGSAALHRARDPVRIRLLVEHGADVEAKNVLGRTPLMNATTFGGPSVRSVVDAVQTLLEAGANVAATDKKGLTALHYAAYCNEPQLVELLLKHGADLNAKALDGLTPLQAAREKNSTSVADVLIKHGATEEGVSD